MAYFRTKMQVHAEDYDYSTSGPFPSWLITLGVRVDDWVLNSQIRTLFRSQLANWLRELRASDRPIFDIPSRRALTLSEKYAVLAAVHDLVCKHTPTLELWRTTKWTRNNTRNKAAISWTIVKMRVKNHAGRHREFIEGILSDVEKDIRKDKRQDSHDTDALLDLRDYHPNGAHREPRSKARIENGASCEGTEKQPSNPEKVHGLRIDEKALLAYWNGTRINISPTTEFTTLLTLKHANGAVVAYAELLNAIDPTRVAPNVTLHQAPQEVKDTVSAIRKAFQETGCPYRVENAASRGYRLTPPNA